MEGHPVWAPEDLLVGALWRSPLALVVLDPAGVVELWSPGAEAVFGWPSAEVVGRRLPFLEAGSRADFERRQAEVLAGRSFTNLRVRRRDRSGRVLDVALSAMPLCDGTGAATAVLGVARELAHGTPVAIEGARSLRFDGLTGLLNRARFIERLEERLGRGGCRDVFVHLDLEGFKRLNHTYGHRVGDEVLVAFADRLRALVGAWALTARLGGDEFAVLLCEPEAGDLDEALGRLFEALARPLVVGDRRFSVTARAGVVACEASASPEAVLRAANLALVEARRQGPERRYVVYEAALDAELAADAELEADLHEAVERRQVLVFYQPIVEARSGRVVALEALARWPHPRLGLVGPGRFVPLAERSRLIVDLGRLVLDTACAQLRRWRDDLPGAAGIKVSVNLSPRQLADPFLIRDVFAALCRHRLEADALTLEVTETALAQPGAEAVLGELRRGGVGLAIDDFGTGFSSLTALRRFPFSVLKIDRSFVRGVVEHPDDRAIVRATLGLGRALGLCCVAEGVEGARERDLLVALGCDELQGYFFGRPRPAGELAVLLASGP